MQRRNALKHLGLLTGSLATLPAWATNWSVGTLPPTDVLFNTDERATLTEVAETIIPTTDTSPGAKTLGVAAFIELLLTDCYEPAGQQRVKAGLAAIDQLAQQQHGAVFVGITPQQRLALLTSLNAAPKKTNDFFPMLKGLVVQGYKTSEYFMTRVIPYELVPGRFHGSVKLKP
jgi:hypothetical protein